MATELRGNASDLYVQLSLHTARLREMEARGVDRDVKLSAISDKIVEIFEIFRQREEALNRFLELNKSVAGLEQRVRVIGDRVSELTGLLRKAGILR